MKQCIDLMYMCHDIISVLYFNFFSGDGQVDFEEFVTLLGPKITTSGIPDKFRGADFDTVFWKVFCTRFHKSMLLELMFRNVTEIFVFIVGQSPLTRTLDELLSPF